MIPSRVQVRTWYTYPGPRADELIDIPKEVKEEASRLGPEDDPPTTLAEGTYLKGFIEKQRHSWRATPSRAIAPDTISYYPHIISATMLPTFILTVALSTLTAAHTVITYPGWRGDNLITNDTFPYGMQWMYPCE